MNKNSLMLLSMSFLSLTLYLVKFPTNGMLDTLLFWIWFLGGLKVAQGLFKTHSYIVFIFVLLNLVTAGYFYYVYSHYDVLLPVGPFDFSAYSLKNLHNINNLMYAVFSIIYLVSFVNSKKLFRRKKNINEDIKFLFLQGLGRLRGVKSSTLVLGMMAIVVLDVLIFLGTFNIYRGSYGVGMDKYFHISNFLRAFIGILSLLIYVVAKVKNNMQMNLQVVLVKMFFYFSLFFAILSYGSRGSAVGLMALLMIFDILTDKSRGVRYLNGLSSIAVILILIVLWPIMRNMVYSDGLIGAFLLSLDFILGVGGSGGFEDTQFRKIPMIPMTLFHFLYVSDLIERGVSLHYSTFSNLILQQIPSFISDSLGYERPLNDNWRLADYFFHGGGFYIFANAYWNGGVVPLTLFTYVITQILVSIENFFKNKQTVYYLVYPFFIYLIPVNIFYGIQPFVRGLEYGLVAIFVIYIVKRMRIRRR